MLPVVICLLWQCILAKEDLEDTSNIFKPVEIEVDENSEYYDDYSAETPKNISVSQPEVTEDESTMVEQRLYEFIEYFLQPTEAYQNTIETAIESSQVQTLLPSADSNNSMLRGHNQMWREK